LKNTPKPKKMTVKQWINRKKDINSYLPLIQQNRCTFTEEDVIAEVMSVNIPFAWTKDFKLTKLNLKTHIRVIISDLTVIETRSSLKTPAEFIMVAMNGMISDKILRIKRMMGKTKITKTIAADKETKVMEDLARSTDAPKEVDGNSPGNEPGIAVIAEPEMPEMPESIWKAKKNIIAFAIKQA
jgi:hypothetical protein